MLPAKVQNYLLQAYEGAPDVFDALLLGLTENEADHRPDPARFTLREAVAHLADWENVFGERLLKTRDEDSPLLQGYDEGQWAIDHGYAQSDWHEQARLFRERRRQMAAVLRSLTPDQWFRPATHSEIGPITLEEQVVAIVGHDAYHQTQIALWRESAGR